MSAPEFAGTPMTKREVLIARQAFVRGIDHADSLPARGNDIRARDTHYPLPQRPRVVTAQPPKVGAVPQQFRVVNGQMQVRLAGEDDTAWQGLDAGVILIREAAKGVAITPERVALWAELLANPTEEDL